MSDWTDPSELSISGLTLSASIGACRGGSTVRTEGLRAHQQLRLDCLSATRCQIAFAAASRPTSSTRRTRLKGALILGSSVDSADGRTTAGTPTPRPVEPTGALKIRGAPLIVRGLTKEFGGTRVVDDVSFRIDSGSFLTLLGPSGSGKTTTLRMIAGF